MWPSIRPNREGDQRNWQAHLLASTRKVSGAGLADKCAIELSNARRLSLGCEPARKEIEVVRETWANHAMGMPARPQQPPAGEPGPMDVFLE